MKNDFYSEYNINCNSNNNSIVNISCHSVLQNAKIQQSKLCNWRECLYRVSLTTSYRSWKSASSHNSNSKSSDGSYGGNIPHESHNSTLKTLSVSRQFRLTKSSFSGYSEISTTHGASNKLLQILSRWPVNQPLWI